MRLFLKKDTSRQITRGLKTSHHMNPVLLICTGDQVFSCAGPGAWRELTQTKERLVRKTGEGDGIAEAGLTDSLHVRSEAWWAQRACSERGQKPPTNTSAEVYGWPLQTQTPSAFPSTPAKEQLPSGHVMCSI